MNKHTDGPWEVKHSESKNAWNIVGTRLGSRHKIARCPYEVEPRLSERWNELEKAEQLANATLMAASTNLLEALEDIVNEMAITNDNGNRVTAKIEWKYLLAARAAIDKARGQSE